MVNCVDIVDSRNRMYICVLELDTSVRYGMKLWDMVSKA